MPLPEFVTAVRSIAYNTKEIRESLESFSDDPSSISDEDIIQTIDDWASEDLGYGYVLVDEDGEELCLGCWSQTRFQPL